MDLTGPRVRLGREVSNDIVLSDLLVSRRHAELIASTDGSFVFTDLGSHNGRFVNGKRAARVSLSELDLIGIGTHLFQFTHGRLVEYVDRGEASFEAVGPSVRGIGGRQPIEDVTFALEPSSLMAIVGPSGAGKQKEVVNEKIYEGRKK